MHPSSLNFSSQSSVNIVSVFSNLTDPIDEPESIEFDNARKPTIKNMTTAQNFLRFFRESCIRQKYSVCGDKSLVFCKISSRESRKRSRSDISAK